MSEDQKREEPEVLEPPRKVRRPFLFVLALSLAVVAGWGGVANGCNTVQFYRANTLVEPPLRAGVDVREQEEAAAFQRALRPVHDDARRRRLPLGVANLLLSGLLVFAATRALGGRPGSRSLAAQALAANAAYAVADYAATATWRHEMARAVAAHFPRSALKGREGLTDAQVAAMLSSVTAGMFVVALVCLLVIFGLSLVMLRTRGAALYFAAVEAEQDEQETLPMGIVARLPDDLANQIAAGEVVERPASVVKELLENALDAGATRITVEVEGGGITLLRITDNGVGMSPEDAVLALERHATSKLRRFDDLLSLTSFGFRGEALPSIASVSRFVLRTRPRGGDEGIEIAVVAGRAQPPKPCGMAIGTTIEVRDLFFNVPARRKFLKSQATESGHIGEIVEAMALGNAALSIDLLRDGRRVNEWLSSKGVGERVRSAFRGEELAELAGDRDAVGVHAFLGRPERARAASHATKLFVNGRVVRDRALLRTVTLAYGSVLPPGRYPVGVVFLSVPAEQVDVNVHPQKTEVRFARAREVTDALYAVLSLELGRAFGLAGPQRAFARPVHPVHRDVPPPRDRAPAGPWAWDEGTGALGKEVAVVGGTSSQAIERAATTSAATVSPSPRITEADPWGLALADPDPPRPPALDGSSSNLYKSSERYPSLDPAASGLSDLGTAVSVRFSTLRFLGQSRGTYLLCEGLDALYVLDQHAASERVTLHLLQTALQAGSVALQPLLFPKVIEVSEADVSIVSAHQEALLAAGIDARAAGARQLVIHGIPQLLRRADPERILRDLLAGASRQGESPFSAILAPALATMACHGSLRAGDRVAPEEAIALLQALDEVDFAEHCPHGKPVVLSLRFDELERKVGRR